jgi:hypothetical protein
MSLISSSRFRSQVKHREDFALRGGAVNGRKVGQTFNGVSQESDGQNPFLKSLKIDELICGKRQSSFAL